ncbi:hypothetical protein MMC30_003447 [Trapelia coarctata]|nr:hypothetical protein [Trapelia coarctata]
MSVMEEPVKIVQPANGSDGEEPELKIDGFESVASYNWLDRKEPSILVPGVPPIWSPLRMAPLLKPDTGIRYVDRNTDCYAWSPLGSLVRAVYEMHPKFDFGEVDIVKDRRPLRKLLAFVRNEAEDFEFGVEAIGNTVLVVHMEKTTREPIPPGANHGYRRGFEEACTKLSSSTEGSTSHHRIVRYNLGGLKLMVRSAFDAYLEQVASKPGSSTGSGKEMAREED